MAKNTNIFSEYTTKKATEQKNVEESLTGKKKLGRPVKRKNSTSLTLRITVEDKELFKEMAAADCLAMSDLLHRWIHFHYQKRQILLKDVC